MLGFGTLASALLVNVRKRVNYTIEKTSCVFLPLDQTSSAFQVNRARLH
ncbi:Uncharacterised protein [Yersinia pekkanenii]|uniref:Uncharacterized protein n=1 Tax=Yersinia pekkanenii TaxID=1288385 RepID=A0A0T9NK52_9GAMM|nr:Uncharacterised protein [Yersinia pekkanenii]CRY65617.1 Uncharacterised protein [Yersinia pekkanenii]